MSLKSPFSMAASLLTCSGFVVSNDCSAIVKILGKIAKLVLGDRIGICDGVEDDATIRTVRDALSTYKGIIFFTPGIFHIAYTVPLPSYITIQGSGPGTIFRLIDNSLDGNTGASWYNPYSGKGGTIFVNDGINLAYWGNSTSNTNMLFKDFQIDGNKANQSPVTDSERWATLGIYLAYNVTNSKFENITIHDCCSGGFYGENSGDASAMTRTAYVNCTAYNCGKTGVADCSTRGGFHLDGISGISYANCYSYQNIGGGFIFNDVTHVSGNITAYSNGKYGVILVKSGYFADFCNLKINASDNVEYGAYLVGASNNILEIIAEGNTLDGVHLDATSSRNTISGTSNANGDDGYAILGDFNNVRGTSKGNTGDGAEITGDNNTVYLVCSENTESGFEVTGEYNKIYGEAYLNGNHGIILYNANYNTVDIFCKDNSQGGDGTYQEINLSGTGGNYSNYNKITCITRITETIKAGWSLYETAGCDNNSFKDMILEAGTVGTAVITGSSSRVDEDVRSSVFDLSGVGASDLPVFHAIKNYVLIGYRVLYTEASSGDAGVTIRVGRYQDGVALDDDYFDTSTSEISQNLGYIKTFTYDDMAQILVSAGDTITCGSIRGKTGTGEVMFILRLLER